MSENVFAGWPRRSKTLSVRVPTLGDSAAIDVFASLVVDPSALPAKGVRA